MKILKINETEKKIGLSIKAVKQDEYQKDLESYREQSASETSTAMGDAFRAARSADKDKDKDEDEKDKDKDEDEE
jgi:translation initiation factor 2 alpha subunit (eIF-2alpha)